MYESVQSKFRIVFLVLIISTRFQLNIKCLLFRICDRSAHHKRCEPKIPFLKLRPEFLDVKIVRSPSGENLKKQLLK